MGLRQQKFAGMVMSVLILEDILAIVMMVMLSAIAGGNTPDGEQMFESVIKIVFFLILWFIVGIFASHSSSGLCANSSTARRFSSCP